ncbi:hypothetical protein PHJA_000091100 [Phtheirospermum japonicum]|uniref:N-acetyltransferase domain-containing protein n=1 Tax=Phtheirospermum japonicum TaxID=374723 RepID=A0A830AZ58_9LAMI|nr:hypothetical protein PHJA_000091100 [Phtheirospermum japonicum]
MSTIALQTPGFSRKPDYRISSSPCWVSSKFIPPRKEKELHKLSIIGTDEFSPPNIGLEFEQFVAREAQLDEEYWEQIKPPLFCLVNGKSSNQYGYISNLCVAKSARRKGIASRMLHFAVVSAKAEGAEKVYVHVYRNNISAQGLYQKLGFEIVDASGSQLSDDQTDLLCLEASNYI